MNKNMYRIESDILGEMEILKSSLTGIHTERSLKNFPVTHHALHKELIHAYGIVKHASLITNVEIGFFEDKKANAIKEACEELSIGKLDEFIKVDILQGGAGTSLNMNINEVLANRALVILGEEPGNYDLISPFDDINLHQSTNDTFPTAVKLASINLLNKLEENLVELINEFQKKEKEFSHIIKVGRTQLQDAVLITLGREMAAFAECLGRDRWRIYKCIERLRTINLGGTAIGTGFGAPREYIFRVVENLRKLTGIGFARAENLIDATSNMDVFSEVSGMIKTLAVNLKKISTDLRLMSSGPEAGFGEINLPFVQGGSSIMVGKINPVIPEYVTQNSMMVMGNDVSINMAASSGNFQLNPFLPLITSCLLDSIKLLTSSVYALNNSCIKGISVNEEKCAQSIENRTTLITSLIPLIGYDKTSFVLKKSKKLGKTIKETVIDSEIMSIDEFNELITPESVCRLGSRIKKDKDGK